jgi:hypothetical protein
MSLLQPQSLNDAARGEDITKGSSHVLRASLIAAVLVTVAIAAYVIAGNKPPAATGQVISVSAHAMHRQTSGVDANGVEMPKETFDQELVFTHVRLHNQSKQPLFLHQITSNVTLDDGVHTSYAAIPADYERLFVAYPELAPIHGKPFATETTIAAGDTVEGDFVSAFRIAKPQWDARKDLNFGFSFRYQPEMKLTSTVAVSDR